jgi:hypothetical protein
MPERLPYELVWAPEAIVHLDYIDLKYHGLIRNAIDEQLRFMPEDETRN